MEELNDDHTMQEILAEDSKVVRKKGKRKGCFVRFLLIATLIVVFLYGLLVVIQYMTDLEAEARVRAMQTAGAGGSAPITATQAMPESTPSEMVPTVIPPSATPVIPTETPDPMAGRTATIAAELTAVADFQLTLVPE